MKGLKSKEQLPATMKIFIERGDIHEERAFNGKASELLKQLGVNPQTVLILKNNEIVTEDEILDDKDDIKIVSVVSGG